MTPKQERFVLEYLVDFNITKAAQRAGYSMKTAYSTGSDLMKKPEILAAIQAKNTQVSGKVEVTIERVRDELAKIGFHDPRKAAQWRTDVLAAVENEDGTISRLVQNQVIVTDSRDLDDDTAAAISEVSQGKDGQIKLKFYDKRAALETLGRHLGMFKDTLEIGGTVSFIIEGAPEAG